MTWKKADYEDYPRTRAADDFWGQVRRTVRGVPVDEQQIQMIVNAILAGLAVQPDDVVLDLACGNGALSRYLYEHCSSLFGVDFSEYLISVAKANFEIAPDYLYACDDAASYVSSEANPARFTKVVCYGSFAYFPADAARSALLGLRDRFSNVQRLFIGNLPDRELARVFYTDGLPGTEVLDDHTEAIGIWRSRAQMTELAATCGWEASFTKMPASFYAHLYRYDVLLTPA